MSDKEKNLGADPFLLDAIYKNPELAFLHKPKSLNDIKGNCLVFLDTNVLLLPYNTGKSSLEDIKNIYKKLSTEKRIFIPQRAMQEFEKNVPNKLKEIFSKISKAQNTPFTSIQSPLLEEIKEYKDILFAEKEVQKSLEKYKEKLKPALNAIRDWHHDDPVRAIYRDVFTEKQLAALQEKDQNKLLSEWTYRLANDIPPGQQDKAKEDTGIGDYLVWRSILDMAASQQRDSIFVTGDSKNDWWHVSDGQPLYVRRELVEEYRRISGGHTIRLLTATQFFKLFGASEEVVAEIKNEEQNSAYLSNYTHTNSGYVSLRNAIQFWLHREYGYRNFQSEYHEYFIRIIAGNPQEKSQRLFFCQSYNARTNTASRFYLFQDIYQQAAESNNIVGATIVFSTKSPDEFDDAVRQLQIMPFSEKFDVVVGTLDESGAFQPRFRKP